MKQPLALRLAVAVRPSLSDEIRAWRAAGVPYAAIARMLDTETDGLISVTATTVSNWASVLDAEQVAS